MVSKQNIDSPCVGICSTVYGDDICRGCKRTYAEIINWNTLEPFQRDAINTRLETNVITIMQKFVVVTNSELLEKQLNLRSVRYNQSRSVYVMAFHLLRVGADQMRHMEYYGIKASTNYLHLTARQLFDQIDAAVYQQADVEY